MKRTIIFSNYDDIRNPFYGGGGAAAIHEISKRLTSKYEICVITGTYSGSRNETIDEVRYERVGSAAASPRLNQLLFHFSLPRQVRRRNFDLWVESLTPPFSTACLQLFTKRPVALLTQNLPGKAMSRKYRLPFHLVERLGLKTYRYGVALSEVIRAQLLAANPRLEVTVIPNGVDPELVNQHVENCGEYVLFLGRIDIQQKGLDLLLSAFRMFASESRVRLAIAGSGIAREEDLTKQRVKELGLASHVVFLGKVAGEQKAEVFRRALFLVMPSRFEGFPLTLLEACCWQLPVVLFAVPELAWLPSACCLKVPPFDVAGFAAAMTRLTQDKAARERMGRAGKIWVQDFSWDLLAERYDKFFAKVLARR